MKKSLCLILLLFISTGLALGSPNVSVVADGEESKLRYASAQHEIVSILLQEGEFDSVLPELEKILALNLRGENEKLVVQEIWLTSDQLVAAGKFDLAHKIIDIALPRITGPGNQFTLQMLKGKIYKEQGLLKEAIELYRSAQELQK
jgi:tetratricopeptide (TPR) repeat protein